VKISAALPLRKTIAHQAANYKRNLTIRGRVTAI